MYLNDLLIRGINQESQWGKMVHKGCYTPNEKRFN